MKPSALLAPLLLLLGCGSDQETGAESAPVFPLSYPSLTTEGQINAFRIGPGLHGLYPPRMRIWGEAPNDEDLLTFQAPTVEPTEDSNPVLEKGPYRLILAMMTEPLSQGWVTVRAEKLPPKFDDYDFVACVRFDLVADDVIIEHADGPQEGNPYVSQPVSETCALPTGDYSLYVCAKNVGEKPTFEQSSLADEAFQKLPIESYDLIFVPQEAAEYGIIVSRDQTP